MKTLRPCVMLWLAREGTFEEQDAAYRSLHAEVNPPEERSMAMSGDDELGAVEETINGLPFSDHYAEAAIDAAKKKRLDQVTFVAAIFFRDGEEAPSTSRSQSMVHFIGRFDFPFPERGDHVPRDEHGWLGIDSAYCLDEQKTDDDGYFGHF